MNSISKIIIITLALIITWGGQTLTGQINVSGVANAYYPVTAISGNTITVGTGQGATHAWATGQRALLIQMTGSTAENAGKFEFVQVTGVSGGNITVDAVDRAYSPATARVQLVWVPYDATSITVTAAVTAFPWNGTVGGIISLLTPGNLIMNGDINATGVGFRYADYNSAITGSNVWYGGGGAGYNDGWVEAGGGGGGLGSGGMASSAASQNGTYIGGAPRMPSPGYGGNGGGGGGGVGGGGGGGGAAAGGGGGGGASLSFGGCGGSGGGTGGIGSINGIGDSDGLTGGFFGGGGGGGGKYKGGGGGGGATVGNGGGSGTNGGVGGIGGLVFKVGGNGGGNSTVYHNFFNCDPLTGVCPDSRAWMGGGAQSTVRGGGIILISAVNIISNNRNLLVQGNNGVLLNNGNLEQGGGHGGSGGGGGGIVVLNTRQVSGTLTICAKGGDGRAGGLGNYVSGGSGGAGGSGAIWVFDPDNAGTNEGTPPAAYANISFCNSMSLGGGGVVSPKGGGAIGGGGCGSGSYIVWNPNDEIFENEPVCQIALTAAPTSCNPSNNTYTVSGSITFTDAPATGTLTVSIGAVMQTFPAPFTSPQAYTLTGLTADGASHTVTAVFSDDAACTDTETYTAPASCQCVISNITATPGACSTSNNTYTLTGQVTFTNAPTAGSLVISVTGGNSVTLTAPFTSPISYSISNLNADGASHTVTAIFSNDILCTSTQTYSAPVQCATPCPPSNFNFCTGDSYTLTAPAGYSGYQWYTVVGMTETPIPGAMSNVYVATMPGTYIYRATDAGACAIDLCCPVTLNDVSPLLSCTAIVTPACGQSNGSATVTAAGGAGGYTYRWSTTPQQTTATATNLAVGTYTVTVTDSGGCSNTCNVNLAPPNSPTCVASVQSNPGCGLMNGSATVTPSGGNGIYTYRWSTTPAQTAQTATGLGASSYTVTVTDGNMCSSTCSVTLTTPSGPTCSIAANTQPSCANLTGGSATASGVGGSGSYSYAWSNNMSGATVSGLAGGTYTVTITDSNNCSSTCQVTITTPQNCCNVNAVTIQNIECYDNNTPAKMTDNRLRAGLLVTNSNASLTTYNVTVNGGTTITPTSGTYGIGTQFTLGPGTAGGGSTFTVTITDSANPACQNTVQLVDPGNCTPAQPECPPVKCGTATIQVNGN